MSTIDAYGELELPEEKTEIEVVENPVQVVMSAYEMFTKITKTTIENIVKTHPNNNNERNELIYENVTKLFEGKEKLKIDINTMADIMDLLVRKMKKYDANGFFLSALQNNTNLETLILHRLPLDLFQIGYKLGENKKIISIQNNIHYLGPFCKGILINLGRQYLGEFAKYAESGIQINQGECGTIGWRRKAGIQINIGEIILSYSERDRIIETSIGRFTDYLADKKILENKKLKTAELMNLLRNVDYEYSHEDTLNFFKTFNWKTFEQEIKEFAEDYRKRVFGN